MPESKSRKTGKPSNAQRKAAERRAQRAASREPLKKVEPAPPTEYVYRDDPSPDAKPNRSPTREIPEEMRYQLPELPEPADYDAVLVALAEMDPLAQEVMLAERLAVMPSQRDGSMPVNIPRMVRPAWAHNLRKLGVFVLPELATHELVAPDGTGMMVNHTAGTLRKIDTEDMWEKAKAINPDLGKMVEDAKTPEEKREAMRQLAKKLPMEYQIAMKRLASTTSEELEPK